VPCRPDQFLLRVCTGLTGAPPRLSPAIRRSLEATVATAVPAVDHSPASSTTRPRLSASCASSEEIGKSERETTKALNLDFALGRMVCASQCGDHPIAVTAIV